MPRVRRVKRLSVALTNGQVRGQQWLNSLKGQGLVEYALLLVFVALIVLVVVALLGPWTGNVFSNVINNL